MAKNKESLVAYVEIELDYKEFHKYQLLWRVAVIQNVSKNRKIVVEGILENPGCDICFLSDFLSNQRMTCDKNLTIPVKIGERTYQIPYRFVRRMIFRAK